MSGAPILGFRARQALTEAIRRAAEAGARQAKRGQPADLALLARYALDQVETAIVLDAAEADLTRSRPVCASAR